jgi:hypothetical protein
MCKRFTAESYNTTKGELGNLYFKNHFVLVFYICFEINLFELEYANNRNSDILIS